MWPYMYSELEHIERWMHMEIWYDEIIFFQRSAALKYKSEIFDC